MPSCSGSTRVVGIQSAATIDRLANGGHGAVFVATNGAVHALALSTGVELSGWPVAIPRLAAADTDGATHDAINIAGGKLYVGTSSNCDVATLLGTPGAHRRGARQGGQRVVHAIGRRPRAERQRRRHLGARAASRSIHRRAAAASMSRPAMGWGQTHRHLTPKTSSI
ncbi:MAG: hypothetical protein WDN04_20780 [Rhodospirillales bacterium]